MNSNRYGSSARAIPIKHDIRFRESIELFDRRFDNFRFVLQTVINLAAKFSSCGTQTIARARRTTTTREYRSHYKDRRALTMHFGGIYSRGRDVQNEPEPVFGQCLVAEHRIDRHVGIQYDV